jgi:putative addiction module component
MTNGKTKVLSEQVRALSPEDRIAVVEDVLDSLDGTDPAVDRLWTREACERLAAYRRGDLAAKDLRDIVTKCRP